MTKIWCWLVGHDPFRMYVGANYVEACMRCGSTLEIHEEA